MSMAAHSTHEIFMQLTGAFTRGLALFIAASFVVACSNVESDAPLDQSGEPVAEISVTVLGTGTPIPTADQYGAAILVQAGSKDLLFDCGRGCTSRLAQVNPKLVSGITDLFLTHLHSDHIVGVDDLWLNGWTQGRDDALRVHGPPGTTELFVNLRQAFAEDIRIRIEKGIPADTGGIAMAMTNIAEDTVVMDEDGVKVTAFLVDHGPVKPAFGYRIDYAERSVVISGDTKPSENLAMYAEGADVILHEVLSPKQVEYVEQKFTAEQAATIIDIHTTAEQAGEIFADASPRLAVYYHTRNTAEDVVALKDATASKYDGQLEVAQDLMRISIGEKIDVQQPG